MLRICVVLNDLLDQGSIVSLLSSPYAFLQVFFSFLFVDAKRFSGIPRMESLTRHSTNDKPISLGVTSSPLPPNLNVVIS